jgi:DNA-binding NtrC family response regulator
MPHDNTDLLLDERAADTDAAAPAASAPPAALPRMTLDEAERWLVQRSLEEHGGNLRRAADALGITRQALYRRLEKHGLRVVTTQR